MLGVVDGVGVDGDEEEETVSSVMRLRSSSTTTTTTTTKKRFSLQLSTEQNNVTDEKVFYGPYQHLKKQMDYKYHW